MSQKNFVELRNVTKRFGSLYVGGMGKAVIYVLGFFAIATIIGVTFYRHPPADPACRHRLRLR